MCRWLGIFSVTILTTQAAMSAIIPLQKRNPRLSIVDWTNYNYHEPEGPGTYAFGYDIEDPATNNIQFRNEERHSNGTVTGSYGYVDPAGNVRIVHYIADHNGYRATEENGLNLSMLRPIVFEDPHVISPEMTSALPAQTAYNPRPQTYDRRRRPFHRQASRNYISPHLINNNAVTSDLYETSRFDFYPQSVQQNSFSDYYDRNEYGGGSYDYDVFDHLP